MNPAWITTAISLATLVTGLTVWLVRLCWRLGKRVWQFIDDWEGKLAEHGRIARPGVLERLEKLEGGIQDISTQVHLDSGFSMKDVVARTEIAVGDLQRSIEVLSSRISGGKS